jgi:hypothetical protein
MGSPGLVLDLLSTILGITRRITPTGDANAGPGQNYPLTIPPIKLTDGSLNLTGSDACSQISDRGDYRAMRLIK